MDTTPHSISSERKQDALVHGTAAGLGKPLASDTKVRITRWDIWMIILKNSQN